MVWGGISMRGVTPLAIINGTVDSLKYQEILEGYLLETMGTLYPKGFVLQQDNAPCHVSRSTRAWFVERGLKVIEDWPPMSPDLNPIENVWGWMKKKLAPHRRPSLAKWRQMIEKTWSSLDHKFIRDFISSMPRRIEACIEVGGGHTKY